MGESLLIREVVRGWNLMILEGHFQSKPLYDTERSQLKYCGMSFMFCFTSFE